MPGTIGIGHTRWATHGEPNDINAHPQVSESGRFAVVHNGIIENYAELKKQLTGEGRTPSVSETDTEVVAQLLDWYYYDSRDVFEAVTSMLSAVEGAYALGILCADAPDRLIAARKDAPLLLGYGEGEQLHGLRRDGAAAAHPGRRATWTTASWPSCTAGGIQHL